MEQEEYEKEKINWSYIEFVDNQDVLDLIEKVCNCLIHCLLMLFFSFVCLEQSNLLCDSLVCY